MSTTGKLFKSASMMAIVTLLSKFLGFFREIFIASKFGSGYETDTYIVAMTATYLIMGMVAGAFNTVLVPIFSEIDEVHGKERSVKFLNNTLNIMFFISIGAMVLFYFLSPVAISILGNGFEGKQFELAVKLNRIGLPIVLGMSFSFIFSGFLQSRERFFAPSATGFPFNIVQILFLLTLSSVFGIEGLMVALVLAIFGQVVIQIPPAIKEGFKYRWVFDTKDKYVRKMLYLTLPVMLGTAIQQVNIIVDRALASRLVEGSISSLSYAARVNEIILGIFVTAITTAVFPVLSKAATQKDIKSLVRITKKGSMLIFLITIPSTIGLMILAEPVVKLFFERGAFDSEATKMTYQALFFYSLGMVGMAMRLMVTRVYYSIQDTKSPTVNGLFAMILNVVLNLALIVPLQHRGLALATSISSILSSAMLLAGLRSRVEGFELRSYGVGFLKILFASSVMGAFVYGAYRYTRHIVMGDSFMMSAAVLGAIVLIAVIIYVNLCYLLRVSGAAKGYKDKILDKGKRKIRKK
ncbi:putative peptidoglycan biosynthesis protein MurJ [Andreesenia angusta]|uniref:Probable lipid II flippase MurJ n=1 Tax=Andreesenia angusta TaxID=39480 RepID=A0A1S1V738_9FIRM|nr:murein biosynthesis integral membrane protein MurJ [Andreesenia angusta]OHW61947.1 putative peptidoglycan biosynthesis protein MurJ [Andreesenia angusta]